MLTEEEAKGKWCPHAIASHTDPRRGFRNGDKRDSEFPCIGSACMAWRWTDHPGPNRQTSDNPGRDKWLEEHGYHFENTDGNRKTFVCEVEGRGYCGLAGAPS